MSRYRSGGDELRMQKCEQQLASMQWMSESNEKCDGSCRKVAWKKPKHADRKTNICQWLRGGLNGQEQTVPRAELEAIATVLEHGKKALKICTDQFNHVLAIQRGSGYCCDPLGKIVDIWERVWHHVERLAK